MSPLYSLLTLLLLLLLTPTISGELSVAGDFSDASLIRQVTTAAAAAAAANSLDLILSQPHHHFILFKQRFNKSYPTQEEHDYRFDVFKANLRLAKRHQKLDPTAVHGVTRFSDLTQSEFEKRFLGVMKNKNQIISKRLKFPAHANKAPILPTDDLPLDFDWRELGAVTPPKDQCDPDGEPDDCDEGCAGGLMNNAFEYLLKAGGLMREKDYPYTASDGRCKFDKSKIAAKVANFSVVPVDEGQIAANLVKNGPLAVGINAHYMSTYVSGVSCPLTCSDDLEHGVLLVGYGSASYAAMRRKEEPYWIIKNSWGEYWGENGYYRLCRGHDLCGVNTLVSTVAAADFTPQ